MFQIDQGVTAALSGLIITGGSLGSTNSGGGLYNQGRLNLDGCTISGNSTANGDSAAALENNTDHGDAHRYCTISGNTRRRYGRRPGRWTLRP